MSPTITFSELVAEYRLRHLVSGSNSAEDFLALAPASAGSYEWKRTRGNCHQWIWLRVLRNLRALPGETWSRKW